MRLRPRRLEDERKTTFVLNGALPMRLGQAARVHRRLPLNAGESSSDGLGLNHPNDLAVHAEQVVDPTVTGRHYYLPDSYARANEKVEFVEILHSPACGDQLRVDQDARPLPGSEFPVCFGHILTLESGPASLGHRAPTD